MKLENKTILIISPQKWSNMFVSKHHYAIELAKRNNSVFFLNPIKPTLQTGIQFTTSKDNITVIDHKGFAGRSLRFHYRPLFKILTKRYVNQLLKKIDRKIDVVISFDNTGNYPDLSIFNAQKSIFFPVDQINQNHIKDYKNFENHIFSVSPVILDRFDANINKTLLNHGLGNVWENIAKKTPTLNLTSPTKIGYFGNLTMGKAFNTNTLTTIIETHPKIEFHFWGNNQTTPQTSSDIKKWISFLESQPNVVLYGATSQEKLVIQTSKIDAFILCYDYKYEINKCSNSHKILEYLSTGKVIISSRISMYDNNDKLFEMLTEYDNKEYSNLFNNIIKNLEFHNSLSLQKKRKEFALNNTYKKQIEIIEKIINGNGK